MRAFRVAILILPTITCVQIRCTRGTWVSLRLNQYCFRLLRLYRYAILKTESSVPTLTTPFSKPTADANQFRALRRLAQNSSAKLVGKGGESMAIPPSIRTLIAEIARNMEAGKAVSVVAEHQELTTQRAANILGVSRPFLVRMVEDGKLAFHRVGSHRRVYLSDLLEYKTKRDRARHEAIKRLAREDVEAGTYDTVILPLGAQDE